MIFGKSLSIDLIEPIIFLRGNIKDKNTLNILRGVIKLRLSSSTKINNIKLEFISISKILNKKVVWNKDIIVNRNINILKKGLYSFPFEIILSNSLSESIESDLGYIRYKLKSKIEFDSNLIQKEKHLILKRLPNIEKQSIIQTHFINELFTQLSFLIENPFILPGTLLPITFYFNFLDFNINQIHINLVEKQSSKSSSLILYHEIKLSQKSLTVLNHSQGLKSIFIIPENHQLKFTHSTFHPNIKIRHWIQIYLKLLLKNGLYKELQFDVPITLLPFSLDHYLQLPKYEPSIPYSFLFKYQSRKLSNLISLITAPPPLYHHIIK